MEAEAAIVTKDLVFMFSELKKRLGDLLRQHLNRERKTLSVPHEAWERCASALDRLEYFWGKKLTDDIRLFLAQSAEYSVYLTKITSGKYSFYAIGNLDAKYFKPQEVCTCTNSSSDSQKDCWHRILIDLWTEAGLPVIEQSILMLEFSAMFYSAFR